MAGMSSYEACLDHSGRLGSSAVSLEAIGAPGQPQGEQGAQAGSLSLQLRHPRVYCSLGLLLG